MGLNALTSLMVNQCMTALWRLVCFRNSFNEAVDILVLHFSTSLCKDLLVMCI